MIDEYESIEKILIYIEIFMDSEYLFIRSLAFLKIDFHHSTSFKLSLILDSDNYLSHIQQCLENECHKRGLGKHIIKYYGLISARTGFGVEELISKIYRYWNQHGIYEQSFRTSIKCFLLCPRWSLFARWNKCRKNKFI